MRTLTFLISVALICATPVSSSASDLWEGPGLDQLEAWHLYHPNTPSGQTAPLFNQARKVLEATDGYLKAKDQRESVSYDFYIAVVTKASQGDRQATLALMQKRLEDRMQILNDVLNQQKLWAKRRLNGKILALQDVINRIAVTSQSKSEKEPETAASRISDSMGRKTYQVIAPDEAPKTKGSDAASAN